MYRISGRLDAEPELSVAVDATWTKRRPPGGRCHHPGRGCRPGCRQGPGPPHPRRARHLACVDDGWRPLVTLHHLIGWARFEGEAPEAPTGAPGIAYVEGRIYYRRSVSK